MNAAEAREVSNDNVPKLIETNFEDTVIQLNQKVKSAAKNGEFSTGLYIKLPSTIQDAVLERLESHYQGNGFEVKTRDFFMSKMFMVSWQK